MNCPNCQIPFTLESNGKFHCETCGWFENVGDPNPEWHICEAPEPAQVPEPDPAKLEPDPANFEPDPANLEPDPANLELDQGPQIIKIKEYFGGIVTFTEVDE